MYILTRYVVAEVLKNFLVTLTGLTLMVTVVMGVKEGLGRGLPPMVMFYTMPYMMPEMLVITIPVSLLLAASVVYGRMTGSNEVIALKSLGVNPMVIVWPVLVLAFILSLGTVWMQEIAATWCRPSYVRVLTESVEEIAYGMLRANHSFTSLSPPFFSITVKDVRDRALIQPTISMRTAGSNSTTTIRAAEAELRTDRQARSLNIICRDITIDLEDKVQYADSSKRTFSVPIINPGRPDHHRDWVSLREIPEEIVQLKAQVWPLEQQRAALEAIGQKLPAADNTRYVDLWYLIHRLETEPYRRLSNGFTCLCFVLIGAPVAMLWRHTDVLTNFFVCFLPVLCIYYPLLMLGEDLSTSGKMPPIFFWMGNVVLIATGIYLLHRIVKR
jgi:lipopolysaccharide export system permease protein